MVPRSLLEAVEGGAVVEEAVAEEAVVEEAVEEEAVEEAEEEEGLAVEGPCLAGRDPAGLGLVDHGRADVASDRHPLVNLGLEVHDPGNLGVSPRHLPLRP